jgi:S-adenosylmethionine hydrolase
MIYIFTDYGLEGPYVGQLRAVLAREAPEVSAIDLMHDAPRHDPRRAGYILAALAAEIPAEDVCLAVVDPGVGGSRPPVIVSADGRRFVGPGDGLFEIVQRRAAQAHAWTIDWRPGRLSASFHGRDLFAPVAALIARNEWPACSALAEGWREDPDRPGGDWPDDLAETIYIDGFGNVMTGLRAGPFDRSAKLAVGDNLFRHARTFGDVAPGKGFWYENSLGLVEIAVNGGSAAGQYGIGVGMAVAMPS